MGDEDDELRRRFRSLGAWYEQQADAAPATPRPSAAPHRQPSRQPRRRFRRGVVGLAALASGVGVIMVSVAVNGLSPRPDDPQITIRPTTATSRPDDPAPTLRPSPSPDLTGPSPSRSSSSSAQPSQPTASAGSTPSSHAGGTATPSAGGGGTDASPAPGGGSGAATPVEVTPAPAPVSVTNGDFEQQAPLIGKILGASPPGWSGSSGTLGVGWPRYPSSEVPGLSGPTAMTLFGLVATPARQTIGVPVQGGATYQLTVAVGCRSTPEDFGGARLSILAGGVRVASQDVAAAPACGRFTDVTVTWTAPADQSGQQLIVEIAKINQGLVSYVDVDHVRLTSG